MSNPTGKGGFQERKHQINRKGRPRTFDAFRELAQSIAHEVAVSAGQPIVVNEHTATVAEMILRSWATSKNPQLQKQFIEIAFGKVPDNLNINNQGQIQIGLKAIDYRLAIAPLAPGPMEDSPASSESKSNGNGPKVG